MKVLTSTTLPLHYVSPEQIVFYLVGDEKKSRRITTYIKCGLDELIENSIIKREKIYGKSYIVDCSPLLIDSDGTNYKFTIITYEELQKIFSLENINNFSLLRYFIYLIGTISSSIDVWLDAVQHQNRVVGNLSMDYISQLSGVSVRSIIEYNKILEENELIYIHRQNDFLINDKGEISQLPNVYGRPCDKIYIDTFAEGQLKYQRAHRYVNKNIGKTNNKRRLAQMYNQLCIDKGEGYTDEQILEIYQYVLSENKKYENMYQKNKYDEYLEKIRDVKVFNKYEFLKKT